MQPSDKKKFFLLSWPSRDNGWKTFSRQCPPHNVYHNVQEFEF